MGILSSITRGASNIGAQLMGKKKKPDAHVTGVVTDSNGEIQSMSYDGVPHKNTSQKLREFNKKFDEKMKDEHGVTETNKLTTWKYEPPPPTKTVHAVDKTEFISKEKETYKGEHIASKKEKMFGAGSTGWLKSKVQKVKDIKGKITPTKSTPTTWGGRPIGQVAGEAASNMLRGLKRGAQATGKAASEGYTKAQKGYVRVQPERQLLQFMGGVTIPKTSKSFKGKNFIGGAKRGRKTKAEKKAIQKEELYQQNVVARLKKRQTNQGLGSAFSNFDLPMGMAFRDSESLSSRQFVRKTDNPYDINAQFNKNKLRL